MDSESVLRYVQLELGDAEAPDLETAQQYFDCDLPSALTIPNTEDPSLPEAVWSDLVVPEVRNAVLATLAEIMPGFFGDQPAEFPPSGPEDEAQSEQESALVNHVLRTVCRGYEPIMRALQASLLHGYGAVQVHWETKRTVKIRRQDGLAPEQVAMLHQQQAIGGAEQRDDGLWDVDIRQESRSSKPRVEWVPCDQLRVGKGQVLTDLDDGRFVSRVRSILASDLVAYGFDKATVDAIPTSGDLRRTNDAGDSSTREVMAAESYCLLDSDGDGIAERRRIITAGGANGDQVLLDDRPWDDQPFALGVPYFSLDSWQGISQFERLRVIQDTKTALQRQIIETGWRNLIQRIAGLEGAYNPDDLDASRRGGVVRVREQGALSPIPDAMLSPASFQLLESMDRMRRESGGGAVDTAPQIQEMGGDTAHGLERLMSAIEQTNAMVARNLAETLIRPIWLKMHRLIRENWQGVLQFRSSGQWLNQRPAEWSQREDVAVTVGLSLGDRKAQAASLAQVIGQQKLAMDAGQDGVLVGLTQAHNALVDFARMMGLPAPEQYWIDPASEEGKKGLEAKQQQAQEAQQAAEKAAVMQLQAITQVEEIKAAVDRYEADLRHAESVNANLMKLLELAAKYTAEEIADAPEFGAAAAGAGGGREVVPNNGG